MPQGQPDHLTRWLDAFSGLRIGVLGDFAADHYLVGITSRISREAPVLILKKREDTVRPGQAGNSAANLAALGVRCVAFGVIGDDAQGDMLLKSLGQRGIDTTGLVTSPETRTIVKTRVMAGAHHTTLQQVIRLDDDEGAEISDTARQDLFRRIEDALPDLDALLISDYGYGTVDDRTWKIASATRRPANGDAKAPVLRVVDSRYALTRFKGADVITPNETEVFDQLHIDRIEGVDPVPPAQQLMRAAKAKGMIMTRGNEGMLVFDAKEAPVALPIFGSDEVTDVTGAGDTVAAVVTSACAAGASLMEAAELANVAGGLVVMKRGASTVTADEIRTALT